MTNVDASIAKPEQAHHAPPTIPNFHSAHNLVAENVDGRDNLQATELGEYPGSAQLPSDPQAQQHGTTGNARDVTNSRKGPPSRLAVFWNNHVHLAVANETCRDHLALERTYLSYLRTSLALANTGIVVAQLFRIQGTDTSGANHLFSYYNSGKPLAYLFVSCAIIVCLLGGWRFWRQQNAMARGKVHASGWEIAVVGLLVAVLAMVLFAITVGVDINTDLTGDQ